MQVTSISPFQHLDWNSHKKFFRVLDSTDRKILSFLWNTVLPTCFFYRANPLTTSSWFEKGFTHFKSLFLKKIEYEFKQHMAMCSHEEYKPTVKSFYEDVRQQIENLAADSTVSKENALPLLEDILNACFRKLFEKPPLNMSSVSLHNLSETNEEYRHIINKSQCYHYTFYLKKEYKVMKLLFPYESEYNAAFILYPKYFIQQLGYSETSAPTKGDLVLYLGDPKLHNNNCRFKHMGMITKRGTVKSYWLGLSSQFEHQIFQIPESYGFEVTFFHKNSPQDSTNYSKILETTGRISALILQFNKKYIPSPLNTLGALHYLLQELKLVLTKSITNSEHWNWKEIQENLLKELLPNLKRAEVLQEFQLWMQEILPKYLNSTCDL